MENKFSVAYIHVHTLYSIKDGIAEPKAYVKKIEQLNKESSKYNVIGISSTEHGNLYSATQMNIAATNGGLNHLLGCEFYFTDDNSEVRNDKTARYHMVVIAKNDIGKQNLFKLATYAGYHKYKSRAKEYHIADEKTFEKFGEGLIATSACIGGIIGQLILKGDIEEAKNKAILYNNIFEEFYLEVQPHEMPDQLLINEHLVNFSKELNIPLVMGVDAHYVDKTHHRYHKMLMSLNNYSEKDESEECYNHLRSFEELEEYCVKYNIPLEALYNTGLISEKCNVHLKPKDSKGFMPSYPVPKGYTEESYLTKETYKNLFKNCETHKYTDIKKRLERVNYELDVINKAKFAGYFLIVGKWLEWCREQNIPTGKGRGSAASSLVNYVNNITGVDPIKYNFLFERFLSPERVEMPDIDSDVGNEERPKAVQYFRDVYGDEYVSQIITFGTYGIKSIFQEAAKNAGMDAQEAIMISKILPNKSLDELEDIYKHPDIERDMSDREIKSCINAYDTLQEVFNKYPDVYECVKHLKGLIKSVGVHAGGVLISGVPLNGNVPLEKSTGDSAVLPVIQISMADIPFYSLLNV